MTTPLKERLLSRTLLITPATPGPEELYKIFPSSGLAIVSYGENAPPLGAANGELYIPGVGATGMWAGMANQLVLKQNEQWHAYQPEGGWLVSDPLGGTVRQFDGGAWRLLPAATPASVGSFAFATGVTLDVAARLDWAMQGQMGSHMSIELTGVVPGVRGAIDMLQPGGLKVTGVGASGYFTRALGASSLNSSDFVATGAVARVGYEARSVGGSGILEVRFEGYRSPTY